MAAPAALENLVRLRAALRTKFTKNLNIIESIEVNDKRFALLFSALSNLYNRIIKYDEQIQLTITAKEEGADLISEELDKCCEYEQKWLRIKQLNSSTCDIKTKITESTQNIGKVRFPKLEIPKFDGEICNWIPFWSRFKKIHLDTSLDNTDKFAYLVQAVAIDSEAKSLVESYPISDENYEKCVSHLISRFGREDLQIQVCVRQLLELVLQRAHGDKIDLATLYDKLNAHLRTLETLGVSNAQAAFLLPLVESALPQETLKTWQRGKKFESIDKELKNLIEFIQKEVESEQRLKMAEVFHKQEQSPTANCLAATVTQNRTVNSMKNTCCIWCDKSNHNSLECYKLNNLTIEQRQEIISKKKACTICLKQGHYWKKCKSYIKCLICSKRHSTVLCNENKSAKMNKTLAATSPTTTTATSVYGQGTTLLQTVIVNIMYNGQKLPVRTLFDSGSQKSYVKQSVIDKLHIPFIREEILMHNLFGGMQTNSQIHKVYNFELHSLDNKFKMCIEALGRSCICTNIPSFNSNDTLLSNALKMNKISLTDQGEITEIGLLIGADFLGVLMTGLIVHLHNGVVATKTKLGWALQGRQVGVLSNVTTSLLCSELTGYWDLETLGIQDPTEMKSKEMATAEVLSSFNETVVINEDGRYEVKLPFKVGYEDLLSNYMSVKKRLDSNTRKLILNGNFHKYDSVFKEWVQTGIIEQVPVSEINHSKGHYLPHRPVIKEHSITSSLRPVFDASAKDKNGFCLNDYLEKGINLIDRIPDLLIGFRTGMIGITADIEKAFLQISIPQSDRDYLKFLWWESKDLKNIIVYRHCRVVFGLTCSPFLLTATLMHHLDRVTGEYKDTAQLLKKSWYVDNCITSSDTETETKEFIEKAKHIMQGAKFNLRLWVTSPLKINEAGKDVIPILGLNWDTISDELYCNTDGLPDPSDIQQLTKRGLLSLAQKMFDPLGYTAPVMLVPKLILQEAWKRDLSWDNQLPSDLFCKFLDWYQHITHLNSCRIPRRLTENIIKDCEVSLHLFCDASKDGYGAVVLLRTQKGNKVSVQLVVAKARITPPKRITIPRLELLASLIGARLLTQVRKALKLTEHTEYCWTDSSVTLCWIKRELPLNSFVGNRVKEIRQHTDIKSWHHIPGEFNWADLASRGCNAKTLLESRWWEGPVWLYQTAQQWPQSDFTVDEKQVFLETKQIASSTFISTNNAENFIKRLQKYVSKYSKLIRMTGWILRFINNITKNKNKQRGELTYLEYDAAEKTVIKLIQMESREDIEKRGGNLTQFIDKEGIIRVKTKLILSPDFPDGIKLPYLLSAGHPIVIMMVKQRHTMLQHAGADQLIVDIRARFWIIGIRRLVKSVIANCIICTRHRAKPVQAPTAPLPPERIMCTAPFQTTGVDLAGPLFLKNGEKCWIVLFTCAVYRGVHLELTRSLSTEAFMMSLRRFIARRGRMDNIMSDNGTNFVGTKNLLSNLNWDEVQQQSTIRRISWKLNAPYAAWWGGYWERLIRIMKDLLRRILGKKSLSYEELQTTLCDCEAIMNGRPLTYINDDQGEALEPLTPAHFIQPISSSDTTDLDCIDATSLNHRLRYLQNLREQFRERFKNEYLSLLVQKGKESKEILSLGDVVLVENGNKRIKWPLGLIKELYRGRDGVARTARVQTFTGEKVRPLQKLYRVELPQQDIPIQQPRLSRYGRLIRLPSRYMV